LPNILTEEYTTHCSTFIQNFSTTSNTKRWKLESLHCCQRILHL